MQSDFRADPFDVDEIEAILSACDREQERNLFRYAVCTGMRPSEYIAQERANVSFVTHQLEVAGAFVDGEAKRSAKTAAGLRLVDMRHGALESLNAQQVHSKLRGGTIFLNPTYDAQWTGDKAIRERWRRILLLAGVRYRNPYQTRHTFASSLLMLGANPIYVDPARPLR
jgi:integrase